MGRLYTSQPVEFPSEDPERKQAAAEEDALLLSSHGASVLTQRQTGIPQRVESQHGRTRMMKQSVCSCKDPSKENQGCGELSRFRPSNTLRGFFLNYTHSPIFTAGNLRRKLKRWC